MHTKLLRFILRLPIKVLSLQDLCPTTGCFGESSISTWYSVALCSLKVRPQGNFPPDPTAVYFCFYPVSVASTDGGIPNTDGAVI